MTSQERPRALDKIGTQVIRDAEQRKHARRRRAQVVLGTGLATLSIGGVVTATSMTDIIGQPSGPGNAPNAFRPETGARVDLTASEGLPTSWTFAAYRNQGEGFCAALSPSDERAEMIQCGAAIITDEELAAHPLTSVSAVAVSPGSASPVLVSGFARPDAADLSAAGVRHALDGATLTASIGRFTGTPSDEVEIRPFLIVLPAGAVAPGEQLTIDVRLADGTHSTHQVRVASR